MEGRKHRGGQRPAHILEPPDRLDRPEPNPTSLDSHAHRLILAPDPDEDRPLTPEEEKPALHMFDIEFAWGRAVTGCLDLLNDDDLTKVVARLPRRRRPCRHRGGLVGASCPTGSHASTRHSSTWLQLREARRAQPISQESNEVGAEERAQQADQRRAQQGAISTDRLTDGPPAPQPTPGAPAGTPSPACFPSSPGQRSRRRVPKRSAKDQAPDIATDPQRSRSGWRASSEVRNQLRLQVRDRVHSAVLHIPRALVQRR